MICCCNDCRAGAGWVHSRPPRCCHPDAAIWRRFICRSRSCGFYRLDFSGSWLRVPPPPRTSPCACRWRARSAGPASSSITSTTIRLPPRRITNAVRSPTRVTTAPISAFPRWRRRRPGWRSLPLPTARCSGSATEWRTCRWREATVRASTTGNAVTALVVDHGKGWEAAVLPHGEGQPLGPARRRRQGRRYARAGRPVGNDRIPAPAFHPAPRRQGGRSVRVRRRGVILRRRPAVMGAFDCGGTGLSGRQRPQQRLRGGTRHHGGGGICRDRRFRAPARQRWWPMFGPSG